MGHEYCAVGRQSPVTGIGTCIAGQPDTRFTQYRSVCARLDTKGSFYVLSAEVGWLMFSRPL